MQQSSNNIGRTLTAEEASQVGGGIAPLVACGYFVSGLLTGWGVAEISHALYNAAMHHLKS